MELQQAVVEPENPFVERAGLLVVRLEHTAAVRAIKLGPQANAEIAAAKRPKAGVGHLHVTARAIEAEGLSRQSRAVGRARSEEHTSELQSPYVISYAVF